MVSRTLNRLFRCLLLVFFVHVCLGSCNVDVVHLLTSSTSVGSLVPSCSVRLQGLHPHDPSMDGQGLKQVLLHLHLDCEFGER